MKLTIITINYNGSSETIRLLESLKNQSDKDFEIIIIDNASDETDFSKLKTYYTTNFDPTKGTFLIWNKENLGFSRGNNVGIRAALDLNNVADPAKSRQGEMSGASWVVLLNNDTWVKNNFIERLKAKLSMSEGIVGIPINEGDKTAYCGKIKWLKPTLSHVRNDGIVRDVGNDKSSEAVHQFDQAKRFINLNYYIIGGGMATHKSVFEKIELLDEKYFLYFEDADFSLRAIKAKFPISICNDCMIYHTVSATTKKLGSPLLLRYHYRNALYFNLKNGPWYIKLAVWPWSWVIAIKQLVKIAIKQNLEESKAILAGIRDFYRNKMGKIKTGS